MLVLLFTVAAFFALQYAERFFVLNQSTAIVIKYSLSILVALIAYLSIFSFPKARLLADQKTRELLISHEWFRQLFDQGPLPYLLLAPDGRIQRANNIALRLFASKKNELIGEYFFKLHPKEDLELAEQFFESFKRNISINNKEIRIIRKDGVLRWVQLSVFISSGILGSARNGLVALVDITERKEIDKAKSEFVSLASHQLRTPLSTMKWYAEMLLEGDGGKLNEKQEKYVSKIYGANENMISLVGTLLDVSRIEMGTIATVYSKVRIADVLENILGEFLPDIKNKNLTVQKEYDTMPVIKTDSRLLRVVLENLLSNAVKYTPKDGTIRITLGLVRDYIQVVVADTGYGIPAEQQDKIFTKLFRADNVIKEETKGIGLGLYMTKSFVNLLGGTISFTSEVNKGSTFTIELPLR